MRCGQHRFGLVRCGKVWWGKVGYGKDDSQHNQPKL